MVREVKCFQFHHYLFLRAEACYSSERIIYSIMNESLYECYIDRLPLKDMNVCRFCVRKKRKMQQISTASEVADLFEQVTRLQFDTSSDYPDLICCDCEKTLQTTVKSVKAFVEADAFWRIYFSRKKEEENCSKQEMDIKFEESIYLDPMFDNNESDYEVAVSPASAHSPTEVVVQYAVKALDDGNFIVVDENDDDFKIEMLEDDIADLTTDLATDKEKEPDDFESFDCETCEKNFRTEAMLEKHIEKNHPSAESLMCDNCGEICKTKSDLKQHTNLYHKQHVCMVCSEEFPSR